MAVVNSLAGIASVEDALTVLLRSGGGRKSRCLVVCTSDRKLAGLVAQRLVRRASVEGNPILIHSSRMQTNVHRSFKIGSLTAQRLRAALHEKKARPILLIEYARTPTRSRHRTAAQRRFASIITLAQSRHVPLVLVISRDSVSTETLDMLSAHADAVLTISRAADRMLAQFTSVRGPSDAELFVPRILTVTETSLHLSPLDDMLSGSGHAADALHEQYRRLFELSPEPMAMFNLKQNSLQLNRRAKDMLGYNDAPPSLRDLIPPAKWFSLLRALVLLRKKGKLTFVTQLLRKSGQALDIRVSAGSIGMGFFSAVCKDISDRLAAQEERDRIEQQYHSFLTSLPYPYAIFLDRKLVASNSLFTSLFPWTTDTAPSLSEFFGRRNSDLVRSLLQMTEHGESEARLDNHEVLLPAPGRKTVAVELTATVIPFAGKRALYCSFVDVSARHEMREHVERIEQKFRTLLDGALDAVSVTRDGTLLLVNDAFAKMFGYASPMELLGKKLSATVWGRNAYKCVTEAQQRAVEGSTQVYEYDGRRKDGQRIAVQAQSSRLTFDGRDAILTYHRDVTARRRDENEFLRKVRGFDLLNRLVEEIGTAPSLSEIYHRGMLAAMRGMAFDAAGALVVEGDSLVLKHHHGLSELARGKLASNRLEEAFANFFNRTHDVVLTSIAGYPAHLPFRSLFESDGYTLVGFVPVVAEERLHGLLILAAKRDRVVDDDDRLLLGTLGKQMGAAVQRRLLMNHVAALDERFRSTVASLSEVLYTLTPEGAFASFSPNVEQLTGYKPGDFFQNPNLWRTLLHPDDRPILSQRISYHALGKDELQIEYRLLPKGRATYIWLRDSVRYQRDEEKKLVAVHGILSDITATKLVAQMQEPAADTAGLSRLPFDILEHLPDGIALFDQEFECIEWNAALARMTGISSGEAIGKNVHDLPILRDVVERIDAADGDRSQEEIELVRDDGTVLAVRIVPRTNAGALRTGTIVRVREATSLRKLQEDVRKHETTLRSVLEAVSDAVLLADLDGTVVDANSGFKRLTGYERNEVAGKGIPYPWIAEEDALRALEWLDRLATTAEPQVAELIWQHKNGEHMVVRAHARYLRFAGGAPTAMLIVAQDLTEHRQLVQELDRKAKQIALLHRILNFANATTDLPRIFKTIADELRALVPYDAISVAFIDEEQELRPWYAATSQPSGESTPVSYVPLSVPTIYDAVRTGVPAATTFGSDGATRSQISIPLSVDERAIGALTLVRHDGHPFAEDERFFLQPVAEHIGAIIQRTKLFEQVRDDSAYIRNLLNSINQIVFTVDRNYRITHVNKAWRAFMRRQGRDLLAEGDGIIGQSLEVLMPDAAVWEQYKRVMDDLFARRIEYYAREVEVQESGEQATYHLVINPMVINDRVMGLVFTQTDVTELNRTEAEIKRRNRELVALNAIATSISRSLDLDEVLRVATDQVRESFGAAVVGFYLRTEEESLILARSSGLPDTLAGAIRRVADAGSLNAMFGPGRVPVYLLPGGTADGPLAEVAAHVSATMGLVRCAIVPLQSKEKLPGAFLIGFKEVRAFTDREQQLLILIGSQIGAAVENAQLYGEIQHQVQTLTTLYELGRDLTGLLDLNAMLQVVYRAVTKALPLDRFYYQAYSAQDNTLTLLSRTVDGVPEFYPAGVKVRALNDWPNTIYLDVVSQGKAYMGSTSEAANDSILAVPIKSGDKVVGIISIVSPIANLYTSAHLRLLESIANLTGVAIGKAMLYEDTLKKTAEIENRNRELDDFTYVVSHDLKEPLISIEGYSKIVMKDYHDRLDEEGKEYLTAVVQSTTRMKHLIDDLLTLSRLGRMNEAPETVSVRTIVDEILHDFQFSLRERHVVVNVQEHLPAVRFSSTRLSMVFRNLISNAMKFNDKPVPVIDIGCNESEGEYCFWVKDNGIGIERQYFERIFGIFQRLKRSEEYRGTGAGLTIVKKIVEREGGRVWLDSVPGVGSTFYFTIKKAL